MRRPSRVYLRLMYLRLLEQGARRVQGLTVQGLKGLVSVGALSGSLLGSSVLMGCAPGLLQGGISTTPFTPVMAERTRWNTHASTARALPDDDATQTTPEDQAARDAESPESMNALADAVRWPLSESSLSPRDIELLREAEALVEVSRPDLRVPRPQASAEPSQNDAPLLLANSALGNTGPANAALASTVPAASASSKKANGTRTSGGADGSSPQKAAPEKASTQKTAELTAEKAAEKAAADKLASEKVAQLARSLSPEAQGVIEDALPHVLLALDSFKTGDPLGTFRELETALELLSSSHLPDGETGLRLLERNLPSGYRGYNLVEIYQETARSMPGGAAVAQGDAHEQAVGGPQGMGSMDSHTQAGATPTGDEDPTLSKRTGATENVPDVRRYLSPEDRVYIRKEIDEIVAAFGEVDYPHSETFEQQVEYFIYLYQTQLRGFFERALVRSVKYMPMVKEVLREKGVPETMAYIAFVESGFRPNAMSSVGATGLWQFMPRTGRAYGLRVDKDADDRLDPAKSTIAAREYFLDLVAIFGSHSFLLAIASYNAGEGKVQYCLKQVDDPFTQRTFWDIRSCLRQETREYIPRIIAAAIAAGDPQRFGFKDVGEYTDPSRYEIVTLPFSMPLAELADLADVSVSGLRAMNPDLSSKDTATPANNSRYLLLVPTGHRAELEQHIAAVAERRAQLEAQARLEAERKNEAAREEILARTVERDPTERRPLERRETDRRDGDPVEPVKTASRSSVQEAGAARPSKAETSKSEPSKTEKDDAVAIHRVTKTSYVVQPGNSIYQIARDFNTTAAQLREWNAFLQERDLWTGDTLVVQALPEGFERIQHKVKAGEQLEEVAVRYGVLPARLASWNGLRLSVSVEPGTVLTVYRFPEGADGSARAGSVSASEALALRQAAAKDAEKKAASEKAPSDKASGEKASTEKASSDKASSDKASSDKTSNEKAVASKGSSEKATPDSDKAKTSDKTREASKAKTPRNPVMYEVQKGNSLYVIASMFNVTVDQVMEWNALTSPNIRAGQALKIYPEGKVVTERYTVRKGDTLPLVARKYKLEPDYIRAANGLQSADELKKGQILIVYRSED